MNKRLILILSLSIVTLLVIVFSVFYFINQSGTKKTVVDVNSNNNSSGYYIEKGAEDLVKVAKPAVESYASQDITESSDSRNKRLSAYFATDSPIYNRKLDILSDTSVIKTTAKVTSVVFSAGEGTYTSLIIKANITNYSTTNNKSMASQTYWITIKKSPKGSFIADDIGMLVGQP